jgi:hypothetical protein
MDGEGPVAAERNIANATLDILRTAEETERTQRGNWSLDGLLSVVHGLRTLPGRKTLVHFSEGLHVPPGLEDPFRVGELRMTPAVDASLRSSAEEYPLVLYYVVYVRPAAAEAPKATLEIRRSGHVVRRSAMALAAVDAGGRIPRLARVSLGPGDYTLRLSVTQGTSSATEEAKVRIATGGD